MSQTVQKLASQFELIGKMNKKVGVPTQAKLFTKLGEIFTNQSLSLHNAGELIKIYCHQAMKYYNQEHEPLTELQSFRALRLEDYLQ